MNASIAEQQQVGSVEYCRGAWWGRVYDSVGHRVRWRLGEWPHSPEGEARAREAAAARTERWRDLGVVVEPKRGRRRKPTAALLDFEQWFDRWIAQRKAEGQTSTRMDRSRYRTHLVPVTGGAHVRDWSKEMMRELVSALNAKINAEPTCWKTMEHAWTLAKAMCRDAVDSDVKELRVRSDNPCDGIKAPRRGSDKLGQFLYPRELHTFLSSDLPPLWLQEAVALCTALVLRPQEVLHLEDFDLVNGTVLVHQARDAETGKLKELKDGDGKRRFNYEPTLQPLLEKIHARAGGKGLLFPELPDDAAKKLRRWIRKIGASARAELFTETATTRALKFRDCRAAGITYMLIRGDMLTLVQYRAGHRKADQTLEYMRQAEALRGTAFGKVFPDLPPALFRDAASELPSTSTGSASSGTPDASTGQPCASSASGAGHSAGHSAHDPAHSSTTDPPIACTTVQDRAEACGLRWGEAPAARAAVRSAAHSRRDGGMRPRSTDAGPASSSSSSFRQLMPLSTASTMAISASAASSSFVTVVGASRAWALARAMASACSKRSASSSGWTRGSPSSV